MSTESNKAIVRRFFVELFNHRNLAVVDELIAPGYFNHNASIQVRGPQGVKNAAVAQWEAYPDFQSTIEDMIAECDKVVVRMTDRFTLPSERKRVTLTWIEILRLENDKIVEAWLEADLRPIAELLSSALDRK